MKRLLLPVLAVSAMVLGSCSTQKLAQQSNDDDVYFTEAKAKEVTFAVREERKEEKNYRTDEQLYGGGDYAEDRYYDDYNYDYGFASRISRFYGRSPWRSAYYDSWYTYGYNPWYTYRYDPFFYDPWYYRPGVNVWVGIGSYPRYGWYDNYYWGYYGSPYASNYWGPYSYYNVYPGVGYGNGGYYGGGYYSGGRNNPNYRTRPNREGGVGRVGNADGNRRVYGTPQTSSGYGRPERGSNGSQNESYSSGRTSSTSGGNSSSGSSRPSRGETTTSTPRTQEQSRPTEYSRPERSNTPSYTPPSTSSSGGSSSGGSSSSGGGSSSSGRPSRGGR